jgi:hypothetical protein
MAYDLHDSNPNKNAEFFINDYDDNRCRIFKSPRKYVRSFSNDSEKWDDELLFIISLDNSSTYDYFEINFNSIIINTALPKLSGKSLTDTQNITLVPNQNFITRGNYVIYEFAIKRNIHYPSPFYGIFGFKANDNATYFDIDKTVLPSIRNNSFTVLELRFNSAYIRDEEERYQITGKLIKLYIYILNIIIINFNTIFY